MVFKYNGREMYHGNQRLSIAELTGVNQYTDVIFGTGLVSVSAMEDEAEVNNFAADDVPDHATIAGASLLAGTLKFMQLDPDVRVKFFGQDTTTNGFGYATSGVYPQRLVQFVTLGSKRDGTKKLMVTVYPNMSVKSKPNKETETDSSDTPTAINWEASVQASGSDYYTTKAGHKSAEFEYFFEGADVDKVLVFIDAGGIITPNYTTSMSAPSGGTSSSKE